MREQTGVPCLEVSFSAIAPVGLSIVLLKLAACSRVLCSALVACRPADQSRGTESGCAVEQESEPVAAPPTGGRRKRLRNRRSPGPGVATAGGPDV